MTQQLILGHWYEVIGANAAGATYVRHEASGSWGPAGTIEFANGSVTFNGNSIDRLLCSDDIVAFDYYGNLGACYRLYQAAFKRTPDKAGLANNVALMDGGLTLVQMAAAFLASSEGQTNYGGTADSAYVFALYINVLGRAPSNAEVQAWLDRRSLFGSNADWRTDTLWRFSESPENHNLVDATIRAGVLLTRSYFGV